MALSSYSELKAAIAGFLHRSDINASAQGTGVDNVVVDLIAMAEAEMNAELRLRVMQTDSALVTAIGSRTIALPSTYLEPIGLWIETDANSEPDPLRFVPVEQIARQVGNAIPTEWSIDGATIRFNSPADAVYNITFRMLGKFQLSTSADTNWLLTNFPNVYLYGALRHAAGYIADDGRIGTWDSYYQNGLNLLKQQQARTSRLATLKVDPGLMSQSSYNIRQG